MEKISRNSLCPCGSGKKYKRCCLDNVIKFPTQNNFIGGDLQKSSEILQIIKEDFENKEFTSIDEMNEELELHSANLNSLPKSPFLGLAPDHIHKIIYTPFNLNNEIFDFNCKDVDALSKIPHVEQATYIMTRLKEDGFIKATQKGNFSKAFVIDLYHQFFSEERYARIPNKEDDLPYATRLRHILNVGGLIKKRSNKFSLTKKGEQLINEENILELFELLVDTLFNKWNWGYDDGYSELTLIQNSAVFNLYLLNKMASGWILDSELGEIYLNAFPALVNEVTYSYSSPKEEIINCFGLRFLERICVPMGLLESREEGKFSERKVFYRVTSFFNQIFRFNH